MFEFALIILGVAALAVAVTALAVAVAALRRASRAERNTHQTERKIVAHEAARRLADTPEQSIPASRRPWYLQSARDAGKPLAAVCAGVAAVCAGVAAVCAGVAAVVIRQRTAFALAAATAASIAVAVFVNPDNQGDRASPATPLPFATDSTPGAFELPPNLFSVPSPPVPRPSVVPTASTDHQTATPTVPSPPDAAADTLVEATNPTTGTHAPPPTSSDPTTNKPAPRDGRDDAPCANSPTAWQCVEPRLVEELVNHIRDSIGAFSRSE